jgi:DNA repair exonuclease SbcCD nuclease subunit
MQGENIHLIGDKVMGKIMVVGDLNVDAPKEYNYEKGNYILDGCINTLKWIFRKAIFKKVDMIFFLGDIFHKKDKIPNRIKNAIVEVFSDNDIKKFIIAGNHDFSDDGESTIYFLHPWSDIVDVNRVTHRCENKRIGMIPYNTDEGISKQLIKWKDKVDIVLGHFAIHGCSFTGIDYYDSGIDLDILDKFPLVIAGHIHKFQKISDNIIHLGSMYQTNWGEVGEDKYIAVVENTEVEFIELPKYINRVDMKFGKTSLKDMDEELTIFDGSYNMARIVCTCNIYAEHLEQSIDSMITKLKTVGYDYVTIDTTFDVDTPVIEQKEAGKTADVFGEFVKLKLDEQSESGRRYFLRKVLRKVMIDD